MNNKIIFLFLASLAMAFHVYAHGDKEQTEYGIAGEAKQVSATIVVEMSDHMKFSSGDLILKKGETVKFVVKNNEKLRHELVIGTLSELKEHAAYMKKFPNMEHDDPNMVSVNPGKTGDIIWQFNKAGEFYYACLVPGHMEAGMINKITVK